ncbi:MAG TPA: hypothetical protein VHE55_13580 [Fimbriimonadaceae bacterium]|nr:hypothetical protein [Fimbriimonadaceae bacterium]
MIITIVLFASLNFTQSGPPPPPPTYTPADPWTDGIGGSISPNTAIQVKEGDVISESITGTDTDDFNKWVGTIKFEPAVPLGNAADILWEWQPPDVGERNSGELMSTTTTAQSASSITHLCTRIAQTFSDLPHPVLCLDKINLSDGSAGVNAVLRDPNVAAFAFTVYISKPGG